MTNVGTVNPFLTFLLVLLFFALVVVIIVMACLLHRARGDRLAAIHEANRVAGRHKTAAARASAAEEQARRLLAAVESGMAAMREAVETRDQLKIIAKHTGELLALHNHVLDDGSPTFAMPADLPDDPYPLGDQAQHGLNGYPVQPGVRR
jgi:hypothetical protein